MSNFDFDVVTGPSLQRRDGPACAIHYPQPPIIKPPADAKVQEFADDSKRTHISETDSIASNEMSR